MASGNQLIPEEITDILNSSESSMKAYYYKPRTSQPSSSSTASTPKTPTSQPSIRSMTPSRTFGRGYHQNRSRRPYGPLAPIDSSENKSTNTSEPPENDQEEIIHNVTLDSDAEFLKKFKQRQEAQKLNKSTDLDTSSEKITSPSEIKSVPKQNVLGVLRSMKHSTKTTPQKVESTPEQFSPPINSSSESEPSKSSFSRYRRSTKISSQIGSLLIKDTPDSSTMKPNSREEFLQRRIESHKSGRKITTSYTISNQLSESADLLVPQVLVHSVMKLKPETFQQVCLSPYIKNALFVIDKTNLSDIEEYSWPSINRGDNILIISKQKSCLSYLPVLITTLVENNYNDLGNRIGPIAIIFCASSTCARQVYANSQKLICFLSKTKAKENATSVPVGPRIFLQLNNRDVVPGCEIVITTPKCFLRRYKEFMDSFLQLNRLCHIVFDEAHTISERYMEETNKIFHLCQLMLKNRSKITRNIQVIMTSNKWTKKILNICNLTPVKPTVCIKDPIEAAFYGKANIHLQFIGQQNKLETIANLLKSYKSQKSLIVCNNNSDVDQLNTFLVVRGFEVLFITDKMVKMTIHNTFEMWNQASAGSYLVLIITDECLVDVRINSAMFLIHYSLPDTWNTFVERFYVTMNVYSSPFMETNNSTIYPKIYILIDETYPKPLPRLIYLLERVKVNVGEKVKCISEKIFVENEKEKAKSLTSLCHMLLSTGNCPFDICKNRHKIFKSTDVALFNFSIGSTIKLTLLEVLDVSHYLVRSYDSVEHQYASLFMDMGQYYRRHDYSAVEVLVGHRYALKISPTVFYRCEVREVGENTCKIYLIDKGEMRDCDKLDLLDLPPEFLEIPQQTFFIYISDVKPYDNEPIWDCEGRQELNQFFKNLGTNRPEVYLIGVVELVLNRTVWLSDVRVVENFVKSKASVDKVKVAMELKEKKLAEDNLDHLPRLKALCNEDGFQLNMERAVKPAIVVPKKAEPVTMQKAFLPVGEKFERVDILNVDKNHFIYVSRIKFNKILENLIQDITKVASKSLYPKVSSLKVGEYYLGFKDNVYHRVVLEDIPDKNQANCFLIDDGYNVHFPISSLKIIQPWMIERLPQQAIQCRLFGVHYNTDDLIEYEGQENIWARCVQRDSDGTYAILLKYNDSLDPNVNIKLLKSKNNGVIINERLKEEDFIQSDEEEKADLTHSDNESPIHKPQTEEKPGAIFKSTDDEEDSDDFFDCVIDDDRINEYCKKVLHFDPNDVIETIGKRRTARKISKTNNKSKKFSPNCAEFDLSAEMLGKGNALVPDVIWYQKDDMIVLKIQVISVQIYEINFTSDAMNFSASVADKTWELNLVLFDEIFEDKSRHEAHGMEIIVKLYKRRADIRWPRLLKTDRRHRNIHMDLNQEISDDETDRVVPILQNVGKIPCEDNEDDFNVDFGSDIDDNSSDMSENYDDF